MQNDTNIKFFKRMLARIVYLPTIFEPKYLNTKTRITHWLTESKFKQGLGTRETQNIVMSRVEMEPTSFKVT